MKQRAFGCAILLLIAVLFSIQAEAQTLSGNICADTVLNAPSYLVTGTVFVGASSCTGSDPVITLTVNPGVTLNFQTGTKLVIGPGRTAALRAIGNPISQITFKNATGHQNWGGIEFKSYTHGNTTEISYATVKNAAAPGLKVEPASFVSHHVIFESNQEGLNINPLPTGITFYQNSLITNTNWGVNNVGTAAINARFCWWGSALGPSTSGPDPVQQQVSAGVEFEPWLLSYPLNQTFYFTNNFSISNRRFNPAVYNVTIDFSTNQVGNWNLSFFNENETRVRTFTGTGSSGTATWDGKDDGGTLQVAGTYYYEISSQAGSNQATRAKGIIILDDTEFTITLSTSERYISPNQDFIQEATEIDGSITYPISWMLDIKDVNGVTQMSKSGYGDTIAESWAPLITQPDGDYTVRLWADTASGIVQTTRIVTVDKIYPAGEIREPADGSILSNLYQDGERTVTLKGEIGDLHLFTWLITATKGTQSIIIFPEECTIENPESDCAQQPAPPDEDIGVWNIAEFTAGHGNGDWSLRLEVKDKAGNLTTFIRDYTLKNYVLLMDPPRQAAQTEFGANSITLFSIIPFDVSEHIYLKNKEGQVVREVLKTYTEPCDKGGVACTYNWDLTSDTGSRLKDGTYYFSSSVTLPDPDPPPGTPMVWDDTGTYKYYGGAFYDPCLEHIHDFNPFNNSPAIIKIHLANEGNCGSAAVGDIRRLSLMFTTVTSECNGPQCQLNLDHIMVGCSCGSGASYHPPEPEHCPDPLDPDLANNFCIPEGEYFPTGIHEIRWAGTDTTGALRMDVRGIGISRDNMLEPNAFVLYGSKPAITDFRVDPPYFIPFQTAEQTISFNMDSFQPGPSPVFHDLTIKITFLNHDSLSVLRTIQTSITPTSTGVIPVSLSWDGRSDNGTRVAPGGYTVTLEVSDYLGNITTERILTRVAY